MGSVSLDNAEYRQWLSVPAVIFSGWQNLSLCCIPYILLSYYSITQGWEYQ